MRERDFGVTRVRPVGSASSSRTPLLQPAAGHEGHTARDASSLATTVITNVAYTPVGVPITTWHSLHPSHTAIDGWLARRRTACLSSASCVAVAFGEWPDWAYCMSWYTSKPRASHAS